MYGIPEEDGLRCCYHGWLYDRTGQCIEQPAEPADSRFKDKVRVTAYPVQELAGAIFAYLGPEPAPLLPRWDRLAWDDNVMPPDHHVRVALQLASGGGELHGLRPRPVAPRAI